VLILFFGLDVLLVFAGRTAIRRYLEEAWRHGVGVRRVLVVGAGRLGKAVVDKFLEHPEAGLRAVGFVDDAPEKQGTAYREMPELGTTTDVARLVERIGRLGAGAALTPTDDALS
jgi:FlaA1/EpsC-like NDP-sugar epimerase